MRAKAAETSDLISLFGGALHNKAVPSYAKSAFRIDPRGITASVEGRTSAGPWSTIEDLKSLVDDLDRLERTVAELEQRRKEIGA